MFYMGETAEFLSWQLSIIIQTLCHSLISLLHLLFAVVSLLEVVVGVVWLSERSSREEGEAWAPSRRGPLCLGASHTHPSGVRAELTVLSAVWGALCISLPSLSLDLMNRPLATVGLSV